MSILARGGMSLGKYCSNSTEILGGIPTELHEKYLKIDEHEVVKTLCLLWQPTNNIFSYCSEDVSLESDTKRKVLSQIARIFDPLGLICPMLRSSIKTFGNSSSTGMICCLIHSFRSGQIFVLS